ncbi:MULTISPECIES: c-type cytochrome [Oceanimonas]|uniref:Cytochrome c n=1 Tax=Oceanimonas smirnovii TaxID=264574 RepID=A0ABW7P0G5_9GAMM|nr:cytochrome c [Oceanimonas sp. CAM02]MDV2856705.1 cytochrome c [Oceanimonas sp. CAM02]
MTNKERRAQRREAAEPEEGSRPVPKLVFIWILVLVVWGIGYYAMQIGKPMLGGDSRTAVQSSSAADGAGLDGGAIYAANCSACHQATGQGIPGAFPPLAGSEWVQADGAIPVAIVHDGLQGELEVAGTTYAGVMPKFGGNLSNAEIAAVLTYIRGEWGNSADAITEQQVNDHAGKYGERAPWSMQELTGEFGQP